MIAAVLLVALIILILLDVPVAFAIGISCVGYLFFNDISISILGQRATQGVYSYPFLTLPMFVFAGVIMEYGGMTRRLMGFANALIRHIPGGLAAVTVLGNAFFGTLCGSGVGGTAAVGSIMIPAMKEQRYPAPFTVSLQGCCGILSSLIPPSLTMVIMGVVGNISISDLLIAGILPGILMSGLFIIVAMVISKRRGYGLQNKRASLGELFRAFVVALPPMMLPVIILGGIFSGAVTVTESAVLGVVYAFILSFVVYREVSLKSLIDICMKTIRIAVPIQLIIAFSAMFGWIVTTEQIGQNFITLFSGLTASPIVFILLISLFLLILGTFMESNALIIILVPILMPVIGHYHIDPIYFAVIFVVNLCIGAVTPPLGVTLMTASNIAGIRLSEAVTGLAPFFLAMFVTLALVISFPGLSTWLPMLMS